MTPIVCTTCGAPVPLLDRGSFSCPFCRAKIHVAKSYRELFEVHAREATTRQQAEVELRHVSTPPPRWLDRVVVLLVIALPAIVTTVWLGSSHPPTKLVDVLIYAAVPGLLPGAGLWVWSAAVHATVMRFRVALAALPPASTNGPPLCRRCGAPLEVEPNALSSRCAYCGTDSLIEQVAEAVRAFTQALRDELTSLDDATVVLRLRRRLIAVGAIVGAVLLGAFVITLALSYAHFHAHV